MTQRMILVTMLKTPYIKAIENACESSIDVMKNDAWKIKPPDVTVD